MTDLSSLALMQGPLTDSDFARLSPHRLRRRRRIRRAVDLIVAVPALVLTAPLWAIVTLMISLADRGPVLFRQVREGRDGRPFEMVKFRSMYIDSDRRLADYLEANPAARVEWETIYKLDPDPRILPVVGEFLRRSSLDELPNLLNVIRGDMTLVGPRPFPDYHLQAYSPALRTLRSSVTPGLTGVWQVVRGGVEVQEACDIHYLRNTSWRFDLKLMLQTVPLLIKGKSHF
jgi:lipopolysaccharide/colanic/teichoic acid biosynthesis glycosyltransferase